MEMPMIFLIVSAVAFFISLGFYISYNSKVEERSGDFEMNSRIAKLTSVLSVVSFGFIIVFFLLNFSGKSKLTRVLEYWGIQRNRADSFSSM